MNQNVDSELEAWGKFFRGSANLGFPGMTPEMRATESGGSSPADGFVPVRSAKMEKAVLHLSAEDQAVVKGCYVYWRIERTYQAQKLTRQLGRKITERRLREMLGIIHARIDSYYAGQGWSLA